MSAKPDELLQLIESALEAALPISTLPGNSDLNRAIHSAVFPGGKRLRPVFTLLAAQAAGVPVTSALDAACAVEFLHCSSLVFDDLPCMDDAGLRRNRLPLHLQFRESTALLAGLALFNEAYRLFGRHPRLLADAADCVGVDGMIGGQAVDVQQEENPCADLAVRDRKTSALMRLTFIAGPCSGEASAEVVDLLSDCGERLGFAYQILDDLRDASPETGKTASQDERHHRPVHSGAEACRQRALDEVEAVCNILRSKFGASAGPLIAAVRMVFAGVSQTNPARLVSA